MAPKHKIAVCLFRNDLRVHDNEALILANQQAEQLVPLYCFDPRHFNNTYHFNLPKTGAHRLSFLLEGVKDLRKNLKSLGSDLVVRNGKPEDVIPNLLKELNSQKDAIIVFHKEVTEEELEVEKAIESHINIPALKPWGHTLYHPEDLPFQPHRLPDVYTGFRQKFENQTVVRKLISLPRQMNPLPQCVADDVGDIPSIEELGASEPLRDPRSAFSFPGGESAALERLNSYLWATDAVASYKETRNGMIGSDYSTKFSPWLSLGCLSPRKIYWEIKKYEKERTSNQSTYWVIFELLWRDYFRFVGLKYGNSLFHSGGIKGDRRKWKIDKEQFKAWTEGRTGVPYVDANMRELLATGFMSNRGRQNVASFLVKDLHLDWRLGAEWFESMLIDHDVTSNYGNWLYSAGIGNDPRQDRKFNVVKQGLDYDAEGNYVRLWVPELSGVKGGNVHCTWTLNSAVLQHSDVTLGQTYPHPVVTAPEWNRHVNRPGTSGGGRGKASGSARGGNSKKAHGRQRGIDFYFSGNSQPY